MDCDAREATNTAFNYLKANGRSISNSINTTTKDYFINYQDQNGIGITNTLMLPTFVVICSVALQKPTLSNLAVLGEISISGTILRVEELANRLQVCLDSGAKKVLIPITPAVDNGYRRSYGGRLVSYSTTHHKKPSLRVWEWSKR